MDEKKIRELYAQTDIKDVFDNLHSSADGLTPEEAEKRLNKYGENTIKRSLQNLNGKHFLKTLLVQWQFCFGFPDSLQ